MWGKSTNQSSQVLRRTNLCTIEFALRVGGQLTRREPGEPVGGQKSFPQCGLEVSKRRYVRCSPARQQVVECASWHCDLFCKCTMTLVADGFRQSSCQSLGVDGRIETLFTRFGIGCQLGIGPLSVTDEVDGRVPLFAPRCARRTAAAPRVGCHDRTLPRSGERERTLNFDTSYGAQYIAYSGGGHAELVERLDSACFAVGAVQR